MLARATTIPRYTWIITDANALMRVHDRMPAILGIDAARRWLEPEALRLAALLVLNPDRGDGGLARQ